MAEERTVEVQLTVTVKDESNVAQAKRVVLATTTHDQAVALFPQQIPAGQVNKELVLGGMTGAKWVVLETDFEVTVKLNQDTDDGFPVKGVMLIQSESGITAIFVTTGVNPTCVELLAIGD